MKGLFSGRQIKDLKGRSQRVTRSQTAASAYAAITLKYGSVEDSAKYFHVGKGNWNKYSLQNDKKRTGKLAASIEEWRERPHKLDMKGVDTKDGVSGKKPRFSVTSLKSSARLAGRKGKSQVKATSKAVLKNAVKPKHVLSLSQLKQLNKPSSRKTPLTDVFNGAKINRLQRTRRVIKTGYNFRNGFTWITNGNTFKITSITGTTDNKNIKYVNMKNPSKTYVTDEKDLTFDLRLNKNVREINKKQAEDNAKWAKIEAEQKKKQEAEYQKQLEGLEGFEQTVSALRRPKVIETLNTLIRSNGKVIKRKEAIIERVKAGWEVKNEIFSTSRKIHGERVGKDHTETVLTNGNLMFSMNKTETDFAKYLIKKHGIKPKLFLSALKNLPKLSSRKSKVQPKSSGKAVTKSIPKVATKSISNLEKAQKEYKDLEKKQDKLRSEYRQLEPLNKVGRKDIYNKMESVYNELTTVKKQMINKLNEIDKLKETNNNKAISNIRKEQAKIGS